MLQYILADVARALTEDLGDGDRTASLIRADAQGEAQVITRENAVICGIDWFNAVFAAIDPKVNIQWLINEGDSVTADTQLCEIRGLARSLVTAERAALNFMQTLSGTATQAHRYSEQVQGTSARVRDTRKTLPGLRQAQKYAVRVGGCVNHRVGLFDGVLIKENHLANDISVADAVRQALREHHDVPVEVEVETLAQLEEALGAGAKLILLDNFSIPLLKEAVAINQAFTASSSDKTATKAELEASGGITIDNLRAVAETGVDFIAIGAITKDLHSIDLSMRFRQI